MASSKGRPQTSPGPWGWENSRGKLAGRPRLGTIEIGCYTDLSFQWVKPVSIGPYTITVPLSLTEIETMLSLVGQLRMGLVLRVEQYLGEYPDEYVDPTWQQLDPKNYHGGVAWEELAALISLALGVRLRAGGILRIFGPGEDELGYPHEMDPPPYLPGPARSPMLPGMNDLTREIDYSRLSLLDVYPRMPVDQARALVRAARSYQEAIWVADSDPRQAWLRLVTAVEVVAELQPNRPAEERLRAVYPEMADQILRCGDPELVEWITTKIADREGVQARFLDFLKKHQPPRPSRRPGNSFYRQDWRALQRQLRTIYQARSGDLHKGSPVPRVMCEPPYVSRSGIAPEVTYSSSAKERRLRLHVFEYIVRHALLSWWCSTGAAHSR
jgi:hypothetical protein